MNLRTTISVSIVLLFFNVNMLFSQKAKTYELFRVEQNAVNRAENFVRDAVFADINETILEQIYDDKKEELKLSVPLTEDKSVNLHLHRFKLLTDDFIIRTSAGDTIKDYKKGLFYRADPSGDIGFASFAVFDDRIMGIVSIKGQGNYNIGKMENSGSYIIYNDSKVKVYMGITCYTPDDNSMTIKKSKRQSRDDNIRHRDNEYIKFYLEGDYALYQDKGTVSATADYMTGLFSEVATLYDNDDMNIEIKEIKIWVTEDNYSTTSSSDALDQFIDNNPDVNADLAHLFALGGQNTGGLAWVNSLCEDNYKFAYSNISSSYNNVPTYSWSVECVAHESGHNIGSPHTHACKWNGNSTQIDDCGSEAGYPENDDSCYDENNPILPDFGTIMSYCHLIDTIGINFAEGFHAQVADSMRNWIADATCLTGSEANDNCDIPVNVRNGNIATSTAELLWDIGASGDTWEIEYGPQGFSIGNGTVIQDITTTSYTLSNLTAGETYDWYIRTDCDNNGYSNRVGPKSFTTVCLNSSDLPVITLPFVEDWENHSGIKESNGYLYCDDEKYWEFETDDEGAGRARFGTECPEAGIINGNGSLIMDRNSNGSVTINYSTITLNLSNYSASQNLVLEFAYRITGDEDNPNDKVWVRGTENDSWLVAYNLMPYENISGDIYIIRIDLDYLLSENGQSPGGTFQLRLGQEDNYPSPSDGIVYDDIKIYEATTKSIPYTSDFSSDNTDWLIEDIDQDGIAWKVHADDICDGDEFVVGSNNSTNFDDWLFSPGFSLTAGSKYELKFSVGDEGTTEKLKVFLTTSNNSNNASNGTLLFKDEAINDGDCYPSAIEFEPATTGTYYIAFYAYSDDNTEHRLTIDNFSLDEAKEFSEYTVENNTDDNCDMFIANGVIGDFWHHFYKNGNIVASINTNGQDLGEVYVEMRDGGDVESYTINNKPAKTIPRYFNIDADNSFSSNVSVRLYFLQAELEEYNNTEPVTSDLASSLQVNHYDGINENCDFSDNSDNGDLIGDGDTNHGDVGSSDYYIQVEVGSFSELLIHQNVTSTQAMNMALNVEKDKNGNKLTLTTFYKNNNRDLVFQRKSLLGDWEDFYIFKAGEYKILQNITVVDNEAFQTTFYRVKALYGLDVDYSNIVSINKDSTSDDYNVSLYPVPSNGKLFVEFDHKNDEDINITIKNTIGQSVYKRTFNPESVKNVLSLDLSSLKHGIYFINIMQKNGINVIKKIVLD